MPQLNMSMWPLTITLTMLTFFCMYQLKMINQTMTSMTPKNEKKMPTKTQLPWNKKWTKIYLPNSLPPQL
ncbi:ATP synthase F0 subunit 8 (mitochondrion) [Phascolarctos cinereus]|uniref:ATP synthase complex subunit 8 n=1 Tax=Phascolarctos cinereus TaxID=38626 RepID=Q1MWJ5_PHACI|nr:ATP synthase F0 subunit 8 [Phascolarctos cinereus]UBQ34091.1 ATP synthase F0 subunit 8 [Phascolarctos cinereus]BAE93971.1 ATP synthase subunit 8 [Phascolarctos cinereus]